MTKRFVLVTHDDDGRDDSGSRHLLSRGYALDWTCPARGGALPPADDGYAGAIVYGGLHSVNDHGTHDYLKRELAWIEDWIAKDKPFLGICLGGQLLAHTLGARIGSHPDGLNEYGYVQVAPTAAGRDLLPETMHLYQAHTEGFDLPAGTELLASSESYPHQAFRVNARTYGFQFHPEVTPQVMLRWLDMDAANGMMTKPGVHGRERQIADSRRYNRAMSAWFTAFLDRWLAAG